MCLRACSRETVTEWGETSDGICFFFFCLSHKQMNACTLTHLGSALDDYSRERPPPRPRETEPPGREVSDQNAWCCSGGEGSGGFVSMCVHVKKGWVGKG